MPFAATNAWALLGLLLIPYFLWVDQGSLADVPSRRRHLSLGLRVLIVTLLVLALSGVQIVKRTDQLCVFFVLDLSDSITEAQKTHAIDHIRTAVHEMKGDDLAGVIVAGSEALVELSPARQLEIEEIRSTLSTTRTDLAAALRLAMAAFPDGTMKRIVLLTDGNENTGKAADEANLAASDDVVIDVVPLPADYQQEVLAERLIVPPELKKGEPFNLRLVLRSLQPADATIRLLRNGEYVKTYDAKLGAGVVSLELPQVIDKEGSYSFDCVIESDTDTLAENNRALGFSVIRGQPKVLYCEGDPGEETYLLDALHAANVRSDVVGLAGVPTALAQLQQYDSIILSDVRADLISLEQMKMIRSGVRDLGIGLVMLGGEDSFGVGGYYQTPVEDALPVYMDIRRKRRLPSVAMELVIDKSGSMGGTIMGASKMALAREAAIAAVELLDSKDEIGVICFDGAAKEVVKLQRASKKGRIKRDISSVRPGGGTQMYGALQLAYQRLSKSDAKHKHVIALTDGHTGGADHEGIVRAMVANGITMSTVAVGADSAVGLLQRLAKIGKGNFYFSDTPRSIPRIFTRETMLVSRTYVIEDPFQPRMDSSSQLLRGLDLTSVPPLLGYVLTTKKELSTNSMVTPTGDPVLTSWRYGLGRSVAFTSDAKRRWAAQWISWGGYEKFWEQVIRWTIRSVQRSPYQVWVEQEGNTARAILEAIDRDGNFVNFIEPEARVVGPTLEGQALTMQQVAPGRYEAEFPTRDVGQYIANVVFTDAQGQANQQVAGLQVSYPPEYAELEPNSPLLAHVTETTDGQLEPEATSTFVKRRGGARRSTDIWPMLAAIALLLFPIDVALRRLMIEREHLAYFQEAFNKLAWWRRISIPTPETAPMGRLLKRKQDAQETYEEEAESVTVPLRSTAAGKNARPTEATAKTTRPAKTKAGAAQETGRMSRLLDAKKRARKR